ncbi:unnamed protein product, partial [Ectocarpus sp. 12 AP-2014]
MQQIPEHAVDALFYGLVFARMGDLSRKVQWRTDPMSFPCGGSCVAKATLPRVVAYASKCYQRLKRHLVPYMLEEGERLHTVVPHAQSYAYLAIGQGHPALWLFVDIVRQTQIDKRANVN